MRRSAAGVVAASVLGRFWDAMLRSQTAVLAAALVGRLLLLLWLWLRFGDFGKWSFWIFGYGK